jgi:hypothetical protein
MTLIGPDYRCTGWIDGWPTWLGGTGQEWLHCCVAHDQVDMTFQSALNLGQCVAATSPVMGLIMTIGVLAFGPVYLSLWQRRRADV